MTNELEKLADKWRNEAAELMSPDEDLRERCEGYNSALVVCARELAALLPSAADGELPPMPTMPFLGYDPDGGDLHGYSHADMEAYARAAIAASRPSAAEEPVAEVTCNVFAEPFVKFADGSKLADHIGDKFYPRPASARPSAGAGEKVLALLVAAGFVSADKVDEARAIVANLPPVAPAADGWVLVPREPSGVMLTAAGTITGYDTDRETADADHIAWWDAMLRARPNPPLPPHLRGSSGEGVTTAAPSAAQPGAK